jgi:hypothetical protein
MRFAAVDCYWLEPNGRYRIGLRRYTFVDETHAHGHDASRTTEIELPVRYHKIRGSDMLTLASVPKAKVPGRRSAAWPKRCDECGERFPRDADWQAFEAIGYTRSDNGETIWVRHVHGTEMAGALYDAPWLHEYERLWDGKRFVGPDGIALIAVCPDGRPWQVDGEASSGGHWTRTGDPRNPPTLTVSPSIQTGTYHGFLQAGRFTDDLGS